MTKQVATIIQQQHQQHPFWLQQDNAGAVEVKEDEMPWANKASISSWFEMRA